MSGENRSGDGCGGSITRMSHTNGRRNNTHSTAISAAHSSEAASIARAFVVATLDSWTATRPASNNPPPRHDLAKVIIRQPPPLMLR